jgi:hypothetical protein
MRGFERLGKAEPGQGAELLGSPIGAPEVQAALATHKWQGMSPDGAMREWVGDDLDDPNSFASLYRAYVEEHPHKRIDITDDDALEETITVLESGKKYHI